MEYSVGILELKSIARGVQAADDALKSAGVSLISAQPICPGKFELILTGELAQVQASMDKIRATYSAYLIDSTVLGRIDPSVIRVLLGAEPEGGEGSVGVIETYSVASGILAADTAVKASNVTVRELRAARGIGGKAVVYLTGEIADVGAAVEAGSRYAKEQGMFAGSCVIGSPHKELWNYL